ncbi:MAG TPA: LysR family transcriptional regulator, partial [Arthrobacter sp.]
IGLLPNFMTDREDFGSVLPAEFERQLPLWAVARPESLRSAGVQAVIAALKDELKERAGLLAG